MGVTLHPEGTPQQPARPPPRTTLLITHRPEGLERMDEVLTLESGVLA